jgi:hypothetical protein
MPGPENGRMSTAIARDMLKTGQFGIFSCVTHIRQYYARYDSVEWVTDKPNAPRGTTIDQEVGTAA